MWSDEQEQVRLCQTHPSGPFPVAEDLPCVRCDGTRQHVRAGGSHRRAQQGLHGRTVKTGSSTPYDNNAACVNSYIFHDITL